MWEQSAVRAVPLAHAHMLTAFEVDDASWVSYQRRRGVRGVPHGDLELHQMKALNLICPLPHIQKHNNKWPKVASHLRTTEYLHIDS